MGINNQIPFLAFQSVDELARIESRPSAIQHFWILLAEAVRAKKVNTFVVL